MTGNIIFSVPQRAATSLPVSLRARESVGKAAITLTEIRRKSVFGGLASGAFLAALLAVAGQGDALLQAQPFVWTDKSSAFKLPPSIRVFEGVAVAENGEPIRAWYADVDYNDLGLKARPFLSKDARGREPVSQMARAQNAYVAINGGYFDMQSVPSRTFSLVLLDNRVLVPSIARVTRPGRKYDVTRSAFGIRDDRTFDVAWIANVKTANGDAIFRYDLPTLNTKRAAAPPPTATFPAGAKAWDVQHAIGAGPTLISDGKIVDTFENEVFFGSGFTDNDPYPRAALGFTARNHLLLFATDGKQPEHSVGMSLARLSTELQTLGCIEAMNLDGGGSETLVVNGTAINHPSDGRERNVSTMLAVSPSDLTVVAPQTFPPSAATAPTLPAPTASAPIFPAPLLSTLTTSSKTS